MRLVPPLPTSIVTDEPDQNAELARRFTDILVRGDRPAAAVLIADALASHVSPEVIQSLVIAPAMSRIGELWARGELGIAEEHFATAISQKALVQLFESMSERLGHVRAGNSVLLAAVEGQHHVLGLQMVADVLESAGYHVLYLGPDVPVSSLRAFALERQPAVAGLGFGVESNIGRLADSIWALHEASPDTRVMLGGQAVPPAFRSAYPYVATSVDVREAVETLLASPAQRMPPLIRMLRTDTGPSSSDLQERGAAAVAARMSSAAGLTVDLARGRFQRSAPRREIGFLGSLTDRANRRAFEDEISSVIEDADGGAVTVIDLGDLQNANDSHGYEAGDRILQAVARVIGEFVRPGDVAARIRGDEFAILLPSTGIEIAVDMAERVRDAIAERLDLPVSVSIGVATLAADARSTLQAADASMYEAKTAPRNGVLSNE